MSKGKTVKPFRMRAAEKLAAERARAARPIGMAAVLDRLAVMADAEPPLAQLKLGEEGARPNNMAPSKYMDDAKGSIRILQQGADSIWLNYSGELKEEYSELLAWSKEDAQQAANDRADSPLPAFDGAVPEMWATGLPYYEWHLSSRDLDIAIRKPSKRSKRAAAVVRISAECLWRLGGGGFAAMDLAAEYLRPIFNDDGYRVQLGKAHIATDYQGYSPVLTDMSAVVKRAGDHPYVVDDEEDGVGGHRDRASRLTGISAGKSTNIRLNFYDKVRQAAQKGLDWVRDLWARCAGYEDGADVWRVEYQFGRDFLRDRGIETIDDLRANIGSLWAYGHAWYSFRVASSDTNKSRWAVASWWAALASWRTVDAGELPKVKVVRPTWRRIAAGLAGYAVSAMALTGITDPAAALAAALDSVECTHDELGYMGGDSLRYKRDTWPLLDRKLAAKRRQYKGFTMAG